MFKLTAVLAVCLGLASAVVAQEKAERKPGEIAEVEIAKGVTMRFCWIPPGKATLGSPKSEEHRRAVETEHDFKCNGFWLGKFEVTQQEWIALMDRNPSEFVLTNAEVRKAGVKDTSRFPVDSVSWGGCQDFLKKMNDNLKPLAAMGKGRFVFPKEDEWEYACRGGVENNQTFYFGNELNGTQANCVGSPPFGTKIGGPALKRTTMVGTYEKVVRHPWGLCDMIGNVAEWCDDLENKEDKQRYRMIRGGSWMDLTWHSRTAHRYGEHPSFCFPRYGLRVCFRPE